MYLSATDKHWAADIEADNLLDKAKNIWCVCVEHIISKETKWFTDRDEFNAWQEEVGPVVFVGHNFLAYDAPMLNRHWGARIPASRIVDTFVLSQLYNPSFLGGHSLEKWGERLRFPKTDFNDFSRFTQEMLKYCTNDTAVTALLYRKLSERMRANRFTEDGCKLEHDAWNIIQNKQRRNGFPFNVKKAELLYAELRQYEEELKNEIYKLWPPQLLVVGEYKQSHKKDGELTAQYLRHREQYPKLEFTPNGGYRAFDWVEFNLGSPNQRISKLLELGWTPTKRTPKGSPQVDEDSLLSFAEECGQPEVGLIAKWIVANSRANMVNTWLNAVNPETGAIHGRIFIASTLRYRHSQPNSANIPAVRTKKVDGEDVVQYGIDGAWTYESRDLFDCGDQSAFDLVGIDGTGIQNRCLVHNLIKTVGAERVAPFKELALSGDVHKHNIEVLGLANKAAAKKFYYTLMMGGGGARLAMDQAQFGTVMSSREGEQKRRMMIDSIPGFGELIAKLERELEKTGRITLCDGTPILVPSPHMVIPYLLQGDESRLMKRAMHYVDQMVRAERWHNDVFKVADIHDEWQLRTRTEITRAFVDKALPCFEKAGDSFGYLIPISGDAKIGKTWAETH